MSLATQRASSVALNMAGPRDGKVGQQRGTSRRNCHVNCRNAIVSRVVEIFAAHRMNLALSFSGIGDPPLAKLLKMAAAAMPDASTTAIPSFRVGRRLIKLTFFLV